MNKVKEPGILPPIQKSLPVHFGYCISIALVVFIVFTPLLKARFINWDDNYYVFDNQYLSQPLPEAIKYFFGPHYFIGNYIPLTMTVYAMEWKMAANDAGFFHKVNLVLHLANTVLVYILILFLSRNNRTVAALSALFFGIHPMHVESVAWVSELKDVLY